jgi:membrane protease YdiL (CAAX protease family)
MKTNLSKETLVKNLTIYATYLLIIWGFYRFLIKLPDEVEELIIKPLVWLLPLGLVLKKEKTNLASLGVTIKNLFPSVYFVLGLGAIFVIEAVIINYIKYGGMNFGANLGGGIFLVSLGLSSVTAVSEEISFRGYIFNRLWKVTGNEWLANGITTVIWICIHVPVTIFVWKLTFSAAIIYLFVTALFGMGSAFIFARTGNVFSSIMLHVLWEWPIILFR